MHEQNAGQFREEHSAFLGVRLLVAGGKRAISKQAARLIVVQPPAGAIRSTLWERGNQRFENERCSLTKDRVINLKAGTRQNLLVWSIDFRCGGIKRITSAGFSPIRSRFT